MSASEPAAWNECIAGLLENSRFIEPSAIGDVINEATASLGVDITVYLVDREQVAMRPLPRTGGSPSPVLEIDATLGGRAYTNQEMVVAPGQNDYLWVPIIDDAERLGVLEVRVQTGVSAHDPSLHRGLRLLGYEIGHILVAKAVHGDIIRRTRRSRAMSTEGEMLWRVLPPLTFKAEGASLAAILEPCYDVGGDAFDYAATADNLRVSIFDAVGHGLTAALTSTLTLAATRAARASGLGLPATAAAADHAITSQFEDMRYVTAILAELNVTTGVLRYVNAGHPPAVLIRDSKVVSALAAEPRTPLGLPEHARVAEQALEPGDRVMFYTDGITEARDAGGGFFGLHGLVDQIERHSASGLPLAEIMRRMAHDVLAHQRGSLADDATLLILEWGP